MSERKDAGLVPVNAVAGQVGELQSVVCKWINKGYLPGPTHRWGDGRLLYYTADEARSVRRKVRAYQRWRDRNPFHRA